MKKIIWVVVGVILLFGFGFLSKNEEVEMPKILRIDAIALNIEIADTEEERVKGLSGREGLGDDEGLLFVFEKEGYYGIWMKDMNFPIDIAWLDKDKKIIHIEKGVSLETFPQVFYPPSPSLFVLEVGAGVFEASKIKIGNSAEF